VPRLDNASWSFFVFFSQDDIFMALIAVVCVGVGLEPSPSMLAQKLRRRRVSQRPTSELLRRH
jgi:hypothetical protein